MFKQQWANALYALLLVSGATFVDNPSFLGKNVSIGEATSDSANIRGRD